MSIQQGEVQRRAPGEEQPQAPGRVGDTQMASSSDKMGLGVLVGTKLKGVSNVPLLLRKLIVFLAASGKLSPAGQDFWPFWNSEHHPRGDSTAFGQPLPVLHHLHSTEVLPEGQKEQPVFQFVPKQSQSGVFEIMASLAISVKGIETEKYKKAQTHPI